MQTHNCQHLLLQKCILCCHFYFVLKSNTFSQSFVSYSLKTEDILAHVYVIYKYASKYTSSFWGPDWSNIFGHEQVNRFKRQNLSVKQGFIYIYGTDMVLVTIPLRSWQIYSMNETQNYIHTNVHGNTILRFSCIFFIYLFI